MASSLQYKDSTFINNLTNTYKNNSSIVTTIQNELMAAYPFNKSLDRSKSRTLQSYTLTMARENIQNLGSSPSQSVTDIFNRTGQTLNDLNPYKMNPDLTHLNQHSASFGPLAYYSMHKHLSLKQHDLYRGNVTDINDIITAQRTVYQFCQSIITNAVVHILLTTPLNLFMPNSSIKEDEMNDMYNKSTDYVPNSYIYNILRNCNSFNIACGKCKTIEIIWDYKNNSAEMNVCAAINVPTSVITNNQRGWVLINGIHSSKTITNSWTSSYILMNGKIHVDGYITKNDGYKVGQKMIKNDFNEILPKIFIENDNHENIENFDIKYDTDYDKYYALLFNINEPTKVEQKVDNALDLDGLNAEIRKNLQVKVLFEEEIQLQHNNNQSPALSENNNYVQYELSPPPWSDDCKDDIKCVNINNNNHIDTSDDIDNIDNIYDINTLKTIIRGLKIELGVKQQEITRQAAVIQYYEANENKNNINIPAACNIAQPHEESSDASGNNNESESDSDQYEYRSPPPWSEDQETEEDKDDIDDEPEIKAVENKESMNMCLLRRSSSSCLLAPLRKNNTCKYALMLLVIVLLCFKAPVLAAKSRHIWNVFKGNYPIRQDNNNEYMNQQCKTYINQSEEILNYETIINNHITMQMIQEYKLSDTYDEEYSDKKPIGSMVAVIYDFYDFKKYEFINEFYDFKKFKKAAAMYLKSFKPQTKNYDTVNKSVSPSKAVSSYQIHQFNCNKNNCKCYC